MSKQKSKKNKGKLNPRRRKIAKIAAIVLAVSILALAGTFVAYARDYSKKILPHVDLAGFSVAGQSKDELKATIDKIYADHKGDKVKLIYNDKNWEMTFEGLGWETKKDELADEIYAFGHNESAWRNLYPLAREIFGKKNFPLKYSFNEKLTEDWLNSVNGEIGTPGQEANLQIKNDNAKVVEPSEGKSIDDAVVREEVVARFGLQKTGEIKLDLVTLKPLISADEARTLQDKAKSLVADEFELDGPNGTLHWSPNTLGAMIQLKRTEEKKSFLSKDKKYGPAYVSFNRDKVSALLEESSGDINIDPVDARFKIDSGAVTITRPSKDGEVVQGDQATDEIIKTLEAGQAKKIDLPTKVQPAAISAQDPSDIAKFGIKELIGTATTDFSKSPANRLHNIKTGVTALSGAVVAPGDEFSTIKRLGNIDASSGYLQELVIKENETKPEFGGGLCQVSTTLFRSAMNAGLKITERQNHSYRVSYYEPPVGMDATIYSPKPDLKFLNDTPSYILLQGKVDGYKVTFELYGTKDGRAVEISTPSIYEVTPPPPDIYIDDPSLEPGEVKRIDRAHEGAKATFNYTVKKDGKDFISQTFNSYYVPWAAKYLRGPAVDGSQQQ